MRLSSIQATKAKADSALTSVGATFTWSEYPSVGAGAIIKASHITELRAAVDHAHDSIVTGTSANSAYRSDKSTNRSQESYARRDTDTG